MLAVEFKHVSNPTGFWNEASLLLHLLLDGFVDVHDVKSYSISLLGETESGLKHCILNRSILALW